ncbi:MAG TPA: DNA-directed RNA polymerase subunit P [Halobacteria archaeon]|nr:DNA-directed RNA polymerase subunit P [Halobacteria archaeon]HIH77515.1 DNA-directed RNA polymerase subunit P [Halobacteria archaeon]
MYRCTKCKRSVEITNYREIRCPYCGNRIFLKDRAIAFVKEVKAE